MTGEPDPFGTAELRRRVLAAWRDSPARFRADANLEDDYALGGYRDRLVVELAQNAADAAVRAGAAGRVEFDLRPGVLAVANTGAPLDAAGVESLSMPRASAKRGEPGAVGRFGVGFAAVLAVTDEPAIISRSGAVRWSRAEAYADAEEVPALRDELAARAGRAPVLRLPRPAQGPVPDGFDTVVLLPLRDADTEAEARRMLAEIDPTLLLLLPALERVDVVVDGDRRTLQRQPGQRQPGQRQPGQRQAGQRDTGAGATGRRPAAGERVAVTDGATTSLWAVARAGGDLGPDLMADRPVEERANPRWWALCAVPVDPEGHVVPLPPDVPAVLRAPTPTDEPLSVPAVVAASWPLDPTRRHVQPGPLADAVTGYAADAVLEAVRDLPADPSVLRLVPVGLAAGRVDGALRVALTERLREAPWLPAAEDPVMLLRPREAVVVDDPLAAPLTGVVPGLLPAGWATAEAPLAALDVRRPAIGDIVEALRDARGDPAWWCEVYGALEAVVPPGADREVLAALPVPLADGGQALGPRGTVLPVGAVDGDALALLGLRVVHPGAAHPLLRALGAVEADPRALLDAPSVRAAVEASYDEDDPAPIADAVLGLVLAAAPRPGELPWLGDLALPADGDWRPAGELLLPAGRFAAVVADDAPFGRVAADVVGRWGTDVLTAVGVIDLPAVVRETDAVGAAHDLDGEDEWWALLASGSAVAELVAVRDLEWVRRDAWPVVLEWLSRPPLREAVIEPAVVLLPDGGTTTVPSYTAWWLSRQPMFAGRAPRGLRLAGGDPLLEGLYETCDCDLDADFLRAIGVLGGIADAPVDDLLGRLADPSRAVSRVQLRAVYARVAETAGTGPPERVRGVRGGSVVVADAADAVVVDAPDLLPLLGDRVVLPVALGLAERLADVLDVALASELSGFPVVSVGRVDGDHVGHDPLLVDDADGRLVQVPWRLVDGTLHVDDESRAFGLGRGRAWRDADWPARHARTERLRAPELAATLASEDDLDGA